MNCMWMAVARGEFERGRRYHHGGVGGKDAVPQQSTRSMTLCTLVEQLILLAGGTVVAAASGRAGTMRSMKTDRRYDDVSVWV